MHILGNMFGLFFFGQALENRWGWKEFLRFYLLTIVLGFIAFSGIQQLQHLVNADFPLEIPCLGASGAVTACIVMFCLYYPKQTVLLFGFVPMPAYVLGAIIVGSDLLGALGGSGEGTHHTAYEVHLARTAFALAYWGLRWNLGRLPRLAWVEDRLGSLFGQQKGSRLRSSVPSHALRVHAPDDQDDLEEWEVEAEVDRCLSKISISGLDSLTPRERQILEEHSRRLKQKQR